MWLHCLKCPAVYPRRECRRHLENHPDAPRRLADALDAPATPSTWQQTLREVAARLPADPGEAFALKVLDVPVTALFSTLGRTAARGLECQWAAHKMRYFYDQLIAFNRHMAEVGFVRPAHQGIIIADETLRGLLDKMAAYQPHTPIFQMKASDL